MQVKTRAIVISTLRFKEKGLIVKCFTLSDGLKSYIVRDAFSKNKHSQKIAYFQPLTVLEIEANHKNKGTLESFKEIKLAVTYQTIPTDVIKRTIVIFLSEMLYNSIHEEEKNEPLYLFLESALIWLDNHDETANFHLVLLIEITKFLGFYPDISEVDLPFFNLSDGTFSLLASVSSLSENETKLFKKLLSLSFANQQKSFHVSERQVLLTLLIDYYEFHLHGFRKPKSLDVLKEIFA